MFYVATKRSTTHPPNRPTAMTDLPMSPPIYRWPSGAGDPAENMAWDALLLERAADLVHPILRFYGWLQPAATFGYFQKYDQVEPLTPLRPLIRRPTGGGLVPHDRDWTYSLVFPAGHAWHQLKAPQSYRLLHEWIQAAFLGCQVRTSLCPKTRAEGPGQCFLGAEQHDLLLQDRKIAGAAQRRTRQGLLIQGSVQPPPGLDRTRWEKAFCEAGSERWNLVWNPWKPGDDLRQRALALTRKRYATEAFNRKR